jgi:hypothetical protein
MTAMVSQKHPIVSAQVVLRSEGGRSTSGGAPITTANIKEFLPQAEVTRSIQQALAAAGFETGPLVGISFSITAALNVFEKFFKVKLRPAKMGGVESVREIQSGGHELPLHALPKSVADKVEAVIFTPPPDFGPTKFGP